MYIYIYIYPEHPIYLKTSIPTLKIKKICSKLTNFEFHTQELKERLVNRGYNKISTDQQFSNVKTIKTEINF